MFQLIYEIVADGTGGRVDGDSKVLQEVLADLKSIHTSAPYDIYEFKNIYIEKLPNI